MTDNLPSAERFSFVRRPTPVPGDLRIVWRLSVVLLMVGTSRGNKASLAKLNVLNEALRSPAAMGRLESIIAGKEVPSSWRVRVEPALGRAIDFVVGEKLADWTELSQRAGLALTQAGIKAFESIQKSDALAGEKEFLAGPAKRVTEALVSTLVSVRKGL